jgi:hypothetical protein
MQTDRFHGNGIRIQKVKAPEPKKYITIDSLIAHPQSNLYHPKQDICHNRYTLLTILT